MKIINLIYKIRRKIFYLTFKRKNLANFSDAATEAGTINLMDTIKKLPQINPELSTSDSEKFWLQNCVDLREKILSDDPRNFLNWRVVHQTMFHEANYIEYKELKKDWNYWGGIMEEDSFGNPMPYYLNTKSSGNLVHYAYSLEQLRKIKLEVKDFDQIVEIGGGYGGMAKLIYRLGFSGNYTIYDLPEFSALQKYYLSSINSEITKKISFVSNADALKSAFITDKKTLFIATWSLSEMPIKTRQEILLSLGKINVFLIAYHKTFGEVDNEEYFSKFLPADTIELKKNYRIPQLKNDYYLFLKAK
jgi:putative sugar O-methyltransferase